MLPLLDFRLNSIELAQVPHKGTPTLPTTLAYSDLGVNIGTDMAPVTPGLSRDIHKMAKEVNLKRPLATADTTDPRAAKRAVLPQEVAGKGERDEVIRRLFTKWLVENGGQTMEDTEPAAASKQDSISRYNHVNTTGQFPHRTDTGLPQPVGNQTQAVVSPLPPGRPQPVATQRQSRAQPSLQTRTAPQPGSKTMDTALSSAPQAAGGQHMRPPAVPQPRSDANRLLNAPEAVAEPSAATKVRKTASNGGSWSALTQAHTHSTKTVKKTNMPFLDDEDSDEEDDGEGPSAKTGRNGLSF